MVMVYFSVVGGVMFLFFWGCVVMLFMGLVYGLGGGVL
jgi:hypothetical protein